MILIKRREKRTPLEAEIDKHLDTLHELEFDSDEFEARLTIIERLTKVKGENPKKHISPDTALLVVAGLIQVGAILYREELGHVISSKAAGFVMRGRV